MKKLFLVFTCILLVLSLVSCSGDGGDVSKPDRPPAFNVLQKQSKLTKHTERGESASFSQDEFKSFLGEEVGKITVTALPDAGSGTLIFNGAAVIKGQTLPADQLGYLKFIPSAECQSATFSFSCDSAGYFGNEFGCEMIFSDEVNSPPVVSDAVFKTVAGISCEGTLDITEPNGDDFTVNVVTYPTDGYISVDGSDFVYTPTEGFSGRDSMVFTVTDRFGLVSQSATLSIEVAENSNGLVFEDMKDDSAHLYAHRMCANDTMVYRYTDGKYYFDPEAAVSKMELLVMVMCVSKLDADITAVADSVVDDDTGLSSGLKGYLSSAAEKGIIMLDKGKFSPKDQATLADAAYMIASALKLPDVSAGNASSDGSDIVYNAVAASVSAGIIETENDTVDVNSVLTKADVAELLCRVADYMTENNMN